MKIDARIPVRFGLVTAPGAVMLTIAAVADKHVAGCACCSPRGEAGLALAALFTSRATAAVPWFTAVVAHPKDRVAVLDALACDPVAASRFRLAGS